MYPGLNLNAMKLLQAVRLVTALIFCFYGTDAAAQRWRLAVQAGGVGSKTYAVDAVSPPAGSKTVPAAIIFPSV